jgi:hypothetical protein
MGCQVFLGIGPGGDVGLGARNFGAELLDGR